MHINGGTIETIELSNYRVLLCAVKQIYVLESLTKSVARKNRCEGVKLSLLYSIASRRYMKGTS